MNRLVICCLLYLQAWFKLGSLYTLLHAYVKVITVYGNMKSTQAGSNRNFCWWKRKLIWLIPLSGIRPLYLSQNSLSEGPLFHMSRISEGALWTAEGKGRWRRPAVLMKTVFVSRPSAWETRWVRSSNPSAGDLSHVPLPPNSPFRTQQSLFLELHDPHGLIVLQVRRLQ